MLYRELFQSDQFNLMNEKTLRSCNSFHPLAPRHASLHLLSCALFLLLLCSDSRATTILVLGDSLSAAYGIDADKGWVSLMAKQLGPDYQVLNASISGETTQGGLARLPGLLKKYQPDWLVLELGANDGLQGQSLETMRANLQKMIDLSVQAKANVLLVGNHIPPNYGRLYTEKFFQTYHDLAAANKLSLVPFMLAGIATNLELMQADGIHPQAQAQKLVLDNISEVFYQVLEKQRAEQ